MSTLDVVVHYKNGTEEYARTVNTFSQAIEVFKAYQAIDSNIIGYHVEQQS